MAMAGSSAMILTEPVCPSRLVLFNRLPSRLPVPTAPLPRRLLSLLFAKASLVGLTASYRLLLCGAAKNIVDITKDLRQGTQSFLQHSRRLSHVDITVGRAEQEMEKAMPGASATKDIQIIVGRDMTTAIIQGAKVEVSPGGNVVVYTNGGIQTKPASGDAGAKGIHISEDFNAVSLYGARVDLTADGSFIVCTSGTVKVKPAPPKIGDKMADGSIYAGLTRDAQTDVHDARRCTAVHVVGRAA
jgi:hypothetical protein